MSEDTILTDIEKKLIEKEKIRLQTRDTNTFNSIDWKAVINDLEQGRILKVEKDTITAYRKIAVLNSPLNWIECKFDIENLSIKEMIIIDDLRHHFRWYPMFRK